MARKIGGIRKGGGTFTTRHAAAYARPKKSAPKKKAGASLKSTRKPWVIVGQKAPTRRGPVYHRPDGEAGELGWLGIGGAGSGGYAIGKVTSSKPFKDLIKKLAKLGSAELALITAKIEAELKALQQKGKKK